ncbi:hypothetical protein [Sandaracinus amylolyticus]|uniref:hypothetical protein n=1 Tax=Sandaracinus amylolyticus TaxID=927083 RepID=UPI001F42E177|nr:hypothetical protein [Sandaracinus amylolyticus]
MLLLGRALAALLVLAACVAHDAPRVSPAGRAPASVRVASAPDVDVEQAPRAILLAPARAVAPRPISLPVPAPRWLPSRGSLVRARSARARSRRALMRRRERRAHRADPDDF